MFSNNSLLPNFESPRSKRDVIRNDQVDWRVREAANQILSMHNLPNI
jgi:hypothetical protein